MMIPESFIAMVWAAVAMGIINLARQAANTGATGTVIAVCKDILGPVGGVIALGCRLCDRRCGSSCLHRRYPLVEQ